MSAKPERVGRLVVVSAPSGAGKSTLCRLLVERNADVDISISYTTRAPRDGERDGRDYRFVDDATFDALNAAGAFLEWAHVHGRRYGTARSDVEALRRRGMDVLLDVDVQGGRQIKRAAPEALLVFVLPPSVDEMMRRLAARGSETRAQIDLRMKTAVWELEQGFDYDCHLINDDLEDAYQALNSLRWSPLQRAWNHRFDSHLGRVLSEARSRLPVTD